MYSLAQKLVYYKEFLKSIKDNKHGDRKEGPVSPAVKKAIVNAIKNRLLISIYYDDSVHGDARGWRLVQPYVYGRSKYTNNQLLRAYQIDGPSHSEDVPYWRLFRLDRIFNIATTKKTWMTPTYLFNPDGDGSMSKIYNIVKFPKKK